MKFRWHLLIVLGLSMSIAFSQLLASNRTATNAERTYNFINDTCTWFVIVGIIYLVIHLLRSRIRHNRTKKK